MDLGDFTIFAFAPFLLGPLALAYLTLKKLGWPKDRLFVDAWISFLIIALSALVSLFTLAYLTNIAGVYWKIPESLWITINFVCTFLIGSFFIFQILGRKRRQDRLGPEFFQSTLHQSSAEPAILKTSIVMSFVIVGTVAMALLSILGAATIYEYYYPPTKPKFGIYDI